MDGTEDSNSLPVSVTTDEDVVDEVDVHLSRPETGNIYLLQYPLRNAEDGGMCIQEAKLKAQQRKLEMKVLVETADASFDKRKAERFQEQAGSSSGRMSTITYSNRNTTGLYNGAYCMGQFKHDKMFLTPVNVIMQMKPSLAYLDGPDGGKTLEELEAEAMPSAVNVRFAREETDAMKKRRLASFQHQQMMLNEEKWQPLACYEKESEESVRLFESLTVEDHQPTAPTFNTDPHDVLRALAPEEEELEGNVPVLPNNALSLSSLRDLPLAEQIKALMINVKVLWFRQLLALLPPSVDEKSVLSCVQQFALLVQGCWTVKSDVLFPRDGVSPRTGIPAEILCRARDYVCWCFTQRTCVKRAEVNQFIKIPDDDMHDILRHLARYKLGHGWEFLRDTDHDFIVRFPNVVERQAAAWKGIENQLNCPALPPPPTARRRRTSSGKPAAERKRRRTGSRSQSDSDGFMSDPEQPTKPPRRRRNSSKTGFPPTTTPSLAMPPPAAVDAVNSMDSSNRTDGLNLQKTDSFAHPHAQKPVVTNANSSGPADPSHDPLHNLPADPFADIRLKLLALFANKAVVRHAEIMTMLRGCDKSVVGMMNRDKLRLLISDVGAVKSEPLSMLNSQSVYTVLRSSDWADVRRLIVTMLEVHKSFKLPTLKKACMEQLQQFPNDAELKRLLQVCTYLQ